MTLLLWKMIPRKQNGVGRNETLGCRKWIQGKGLDEKIFNQQSSSSILIVANENK